MAKLPKFEIDVKNLPEFEQVVEENKELKKRLKRAEKALKDAGFEDHGAELIKPPVNKWGGYWWKLKFYIGAGFPAEALKIESADFNAGIVAAYSRILNKMDEITKADLLAKKFD